MSQINNNGNTLVGDILADEDRSTKHGNLPPQTQDTKLYLEHMVGVFCETHHVSSPEP